MDDLDEVIIWNMLNNDLEEAEEEAVAAENFERLHFNRQNPLEVMSDLMFIQHFRLNKISFNELLQELKDIDNVVEVRSTALSLTTKLLVTLMFYGQGSYQRVMGSNCFIGLSQGSVSRAIEHISNLLNNPQITSRWIKFPRNIEELVQQRRRFYDATGIPGGVGVIDCTHVAIFMPRDDENIYVNRKNYHSLNVQLICDENLKIMNVNSNFPGSAHDSYIWAQSNISRIMEEIYRNDPHNNFFLLGDSGYPLRPWLITPLRDPAPGMEERFNNCFKTARSIIERCNGVLKNRFRCLLKHRVLHYKPEKSAKIIIACCVLHNICINNNIPEPEVDEPFEVMDMVQNVQHPVPNALGNADLLAGRQLRQTIIENHFNM